MSLVLHRFAQPSDAIAAAAFVPGLARVLVDCVDGGASISFLPPLALGDAVRFWTDVVAGVAAGDRALIVAQHDGDDGEVVGTVQVVLAGVANGAHRAEIAKLLVARQARRRGIARQLVIDAEAAAVAAGRRLVVLDTERGGAAETLYRDLGWIEVGVIPDYAIHRGGYCDTVIFYKRVG